MSSSRHEAAEGCLRLGSRQATSQTTRQTGSHLRLTSSIMGRPHHVTVPLHRVIAVGTLARIVADVAQYLELDRDAVVQQLFGNG